MKVESGTLLLMSESTLAKGNSLEGWGWSVTIKVDCQLLNYIGGIIEVVGLHGTEVPESGMFLLMLGSTLQPGNRLRVDLSNTKKMPVASLYKGGGRKQLVYSAPYSRSVECCC